MVSTVWTYTVHVCMSRLYSLVSKPFTCWVPPLHGRTSAGFRAPGPRRIHTISTVPSLMNPETTATIPIGSMYVIYGNIYHQYTPFMLAYIPAPWIRHGICKDPHMFFEFCIAPPGPPIPHPVQVPNPSAAVAPKLPAKPPGVPTGSRSAQRSCLCCVSHEKQNTVGGARHEETRTVANLGTVQYP